MGSMSNRESMTKRKTGFVDGVTRFLRIEFSNEEKRKTGTERILLTAKNAENTKNANGFSFYDGRFSCFNRDCNGSGKRRVTISRVLHMVQSATESA
jgi:hypothetical protein